MSAQARAEAGLAMNDADEEFTGKYEKSGWIGRLLVDRFYDSVRRLLEPVAQPGRSLLELGCGAGYSTQRLRAWMPAGVTYCASDISPTLVAKARQRNPWLDVKEQSVYTLAAEDKSIDVLVMMEVLEHLDDPKRALAELARVARKYVLISTPREPIWRVLNMARGKYWVDLGNTPGHVQHWSSMGLCRATAPWFDVAGMAQPLPWTILLLTPAS